jgi:hypothetical protein
MLLLAKAVSKSKNDKMAKVSESTGSTAGSFWHAHQIAADCQELTDFLFASGYDKAEAARQRRLAAACRYAIARRSIREDPDNYSLIQELDQSAAAHEVACKESRRAEDDLAPIFVCKVLVDQSYDRNINASLEHYRSNEDEYISIAQFEATLEGKFIQLAP